VQPRVILHAWATSRPSCCRGDPAGNHPRPPGMPRGARSAPTPRGCSRSTIPRPRSNTPRTLESLRRGLPRAPGRAGAPARPARRATRGGAAPAGSGPRACAGGPGGRRAAPARAAGALLSAATERFESDGPAATEAIGAISRRGSSPATSSTCSASWGRGRPRWCAAPAGRGRAGPGHEPHLRDRPPLRGGAPGLLVAHLRPLSPAQPRRRGPRPARGLPRRRRYRPSSSGRPRRPARRWAPPRITVELTHIGHTRRSIEVRG